MNGNIQQFDFTIVMNDNSVVNLTSFEELGHLPERRDMYGNYIVTIYDKDLNFVETKTYLLSDIRDININENTKIVVK